MSRTVTIGSDAELFLNHSADGLVPATEYNTPGDKKSPIPSDYGSFHRDNVLVELQPTATTEPRQFMRNAQNLYSQLERLYSGPGLYMDPTPSRRFLAERLEMPEAQEIGCEPDFCAYTGMRAEPTSAEVMGTTRVGSGHIHIGGIDDFNDVKRRAVVQWMDRFEGLSCAIQDLQEEGNPHRRRFYGQAGRYRLKPYGVEWRTPSNLNWWTWSRHTSGQLFASVNSAVQLVEAEIYAADTFTAESVEQMRLAIDSADERLLWREITATQEELNTGAVRDVVDHNEGIFGYVPHVYTI